MATKTTPTGAEIAALLSVERAARAVMRFPHDLRPKQALARALRRLDQARIKED
jgi:hypothetical protein